MIEQVTGHTFVEYMETGILIPLGMHRSGFAWSDNMEDPVAVGYNLKGHPVPAYVYPGKASGGLLSNVEDIAALLNFNPKFSRVTTRNIYPLLAVYDRFIEYDVQKNSYEGHPVKTIMAGHVTGSLNTVLLRNHILEVLRDQRIS